MGRGVTHFSYGLVGASMCSYSGSDMNVYMAAARNQRVG